MVDDQATSSADGKLLPMHHNKSTNPLYKTEMCKNWSEIGDCRYGRSCQFAHGKKEIRPLKRHRQWKTKTCLAWARGGCTYHHRCCYARKSTSHFFSRSRKINESSQMSGFRTMADTLLTSSWTSFVVLSIVAPPQSLPLLIQAASLPMTTSSDVDLLPATRPRTIRADAGTPSTSPSSRSACKLYPFTKTMFELTSALAGATTKTRKGRFLSYLV